MVHLFINRVHLFNIDPSEEKKEPVAATIETAQADEPEKPMQEQLSLI